MATNTFNSIHHHHHHTTTTAAGKNTSLLPPNQFFISTTTKNTFSHSPITTNQFSGATLLPHSPAATATTTPSTSQDVSFDLLKQHLSSKNFREADEETRRLLIVLAGDAAVKRGYVFFSEVKFIPENDLKTIDGLWRQHSDDKFGYSVQKRIWNKVNNDFTNFFIKVGWMKKLESSEVEQYNYRSFPTEFMWEMEQETPEGHLPLTNALRGTQLLNSIFMHPAFQGDEDCDDDDGENVEKKEERDNGISNNKTLRNKIFKTNYTF